LIVRTAFRGCFRLLGDNSSAPPAPRSIHRNSADLITKPYDDFHSQLNDRPSHFCNREAAPKTINLPEIMNDTPIHLTRDDHAKLRLLVNTALYTTSTPSLAKLRDELDRAVVLPPEASPAGLVTMDSQVEFEDLATGEVEAYVISFPDRANVDQKRISILAPIGTALIGYREGDIVSWTTPGGNRRMKIRRVTQSVAAPAELAMSASNGLPASRP
jgi:regulator of nucleoside diphosphate kinase